jgi:uncharacterized protein YbaR (Trm112 family)
VQLVCPRDRRALVRDGTELVCPGAHRYPVIDGVPVLLLAEEPPTHAACRASLGPRKADADAEAMVQDVIAATCGNLYRHLSAT